MSSHSQPRSRPSAPSVRPHLSVWVAVLQAMLLCLGLFCLGLAVQFGHTWLQHSAALNPVATSSSLLTPALDLLIQAALWFAAAVVLLSAALWWRARHQNCPGASQTVDVLLEPGPAVLQPVPITSAHPSCATAQTSALTSAATATTTASTQDTPSLTPPADLTWAGWQTLQTELLRSLPGPAMLVQRTPEGWHLLDRNEDARATLPAKSTPALDRIVTDLIDQTEPAGADSQATAGQTGYPMNMAMRLLELPSGCSILWRPPAPPESESLTAPRVSTPIPPAPPSPTDEDRTALVYTVSHDLRAPIRVIEGFTRILVEDYGHVLDRVGNDHLERILGAATRMNSMIDALLDLSRLSTQELKQECVDLSALALQVQLELQQQSPQRSAQWHIAPGLQAQGDPTLLHSVMENLLGNAWKYTARCDLTRIEFGQTEHRGQTVFFVRDNGAGFDMRFAGKLFGAFQRLHGATEFAGTGIGLASVRRILRRHGGDIWAEGVVNEGATFYFTLPQTPTGKASCSTA